MEHFLFNCKVYTLRKSPPTNIVARILEFFIRFVKALGLIVQNPSYPGENAMHPSEETSYEDEKTVGILFVTVDVTFFMTILLIVDKNIIFIFMGIQEIMFSFLMFRNHEQYVDRPQKQIKQPRYCKLEHLGLI